MTDKIKKAVRDIARRMEAGESITPAELAAIADMDGGTATRGRGRPKQEGRSVYDWRWAAIVQFYRRLLPGYRGTKGADPKVLR